MILLAPKWLAGFSGAFVDAYDYATFFTVTAFLGLPVLLLVWLATRLTPEADRPAGSAAAQPPAES
jgi:PAT family beta-lactamase induction signal transducer AmpG